jgi:mono/diheme cytochrome c family protein
MSELKDEYNRGGLIAFTFSIIFVCLFFVYVVYVNKGVDLAENVKDPAELLNVPVKPELDITKVAEPWVSSPELVEYGHKVFATNCALCHGTEGKGDGVAGKGLNPPPRNFVEGKWTQGEGIIAHFKVLEHGIPGSSMASFSNLKSADRWAVLQFIESITNNKSKDDPAKVAEFAKTAK